MIRQTTENDAWQLLDVINNAASAYKSIVSEEHRHDPYMTDEELASQSEGGVKFYRGLLKLETRVV